jgi:hypothetical protein
MENPIPMPEVIIKQNPPTFFFLNPEPTPQWNPTILTSEPSVLPKGSSEFEAGIAASILILPRLNPAGAIVTLGVVSLYVGYSLTLPPSSALGPPYFNAPDNTIIFRPPYIFQTKEKDDLLKGGGQNKRDADIKRYPSEFVRWYHKEYKRKVNPGRNSTLEELKEAFDYWESEGKPRTK